MADLPLTGGCMCGGVRFEISAPLVTSVYCHCTRCQRRTGTAAAASARIAPGSLSVLSGEELVRYWNPPAGFSKAFCSACGSALWSRSQEDPELIGVRLGAFDDDPGIRPSAHTFVAYAAVWEPLPDDGLPRYPEGRPAAK
jgi:hypothetical protein